MQRNTTGIISSLYNQFFGYDSYVTIHVESYQVLPNYEEKIMNSRKAGKFLDGINFGPIDAGKAMVLTHPPDVQTFLFY